MPVIRVSDLGINDVSIVSLHCHTVMYVHTLRGCPRKTHICFTCNFHIFHVELQSLSTVFNIASFTKIYRQLGQFAGQIRPQFTRACQFSKEQKCHFVVQNRVQAPVLVT